MFPMTSLFLSLPHHSPTHPPPSTSYSLTLSDYLSPELSSFLLWIQSTPTKASSIHRSSVTSADCFPQSSAKSARRSLSSSGSSAKVSLFVINLPSPKSPLPVHYAGVPPGIQDLIQKVRANTDALGCKSSHLPLLRLPSSTYSHLSASPAITCFMAHCLIRVYDSGPTAQDPSSLPKH